MNILFLTLEQSGVKHTPILDWLTSPATGAGKNEENYWIINTDVQLANPSQDSEVFKTIMLLHECINRGYTHLMIKKNGNISTDGQGDIPAST